MDTEREAIEASADPGAAPPDRDAARRSASHSGRSDPYLWQSLAWVALLLGTLVLIGVSAVVARPRTPKSEVVVVHSEAVDAAGSVEALLASDAFKHGQKLFLGTCTACHGPHGESKPGLGKNLTKSTFVAGLSDEELLAFIKRGRNPGEPLNTTGVQMPPKGGNPALNDDKLRDIIVFIRGLQATGGKVPDA